MTIAEETRALLEEAGALKHGHFILSSGLHSDRYCQCATLFEKPEIASKVALLLKRSLPADLKIDVVLSPALGGVLWGYELSRVLGCRNVFAERQPGAAFELKRGFDIHPGERVLLAEDVVTTGGSVSELVPLVKGAGADLVGFAVIADRSRGAFKPAGGALLFALTTLDFETFKPEALPERLRSIPAVKPGSRVKAPATQEVTR